MAITCHWGTVALAIRISNAEMPHPLATPTTRLTVIHTAYWTSVNPPSPTNFPVNSSRDRNDTSNSSIGS